MKNESHRFIYYSFSLLLLKSETNEKSNKPVFEIYIYMFSLATTEVMFKINWFYSCVNMFLKVNIIFEAQYPLT